MGRHIQTWVYWIIVGGAIVLFLDGLCDVFKGQVTDRGRTVMMWSLIIIVVGIIINKTKTIRLTVGQLGG